MKFPTTRREVFNHLVEKFPDQFINVAKEAVHVVLTLKADNGKAYFCATHTRGYANRTLEGWVDMVTMKLKEINHVWGT